MKVNLNNELTLGEGSWKITGITGLGHADIRTSQFLYSGRDGGEVTDQNYGFRQLDVTGKLLADTCDGHQADRLAFMAATPIGVTIPVYVTVFTGETYVVYCRVTKPILDFTGELESDFMLQLLAGDPLFYSLDGGEIQSAPIAKVVTSGGYITPYVLPVIWEAGGAATTVTNSGNATVYPRIELYDKATDPTITNTATGEVFSLDINTVEGDTLVIDMFNRTVTLNGSDIIGNKTPDSTWWGLLPGDNGIMLVSAAADDTLSGLMTWRNGLTGI